MVEAELVPFDAIDARLSMLDDWQVLFALHHHERPCDGLITTDSSRIRLPRELSVICRPGSPWWSLTPQGTTRSRPSDSCSRICRGCARARARTLGPGMGTRVLRVAQRPHHDPQSLPDGAPAGQGASADVLYAGAHFSPTELEGIRWPRSECPRPPLDSIAAIASQWAKKQSGSTCGKGGDRWSGVLVRSGPQGGPQPPRCQSETCLCAGP